jgi:L-rhamnose mutarotase
LALKTKLKRWQAIMKKIHSGNFTEEEMQEDFEELEIE